MGVLAEGLDALVVRAISEDGEILGELRDRYTITVRFRSEDSYLGYPDERAISEELSGLLDMLLEGRREGQRSIITELTNLKLDDGKHWDAMERRFRAERDEIPVVGMSNQGFVTAMCTGLRNPSVSLSDTTFDSLDEPSFLHELHSALTDMWRDWGNQLHALKAKYRQLHRLTRSIASRRAMWAPTPSSTVPMLGAMVGRAAFSAPARDPRRHGNR